MCSQNVGLPRRSRRVGSRQSSLSGGAQQISSSGAVCGLAGRTEETMKMIFMEELYSEMYEFSRSVYRVQ